MAVRPRSTRLLPVRGTGVAMLAVILAGGGLLSLGAGRVEAVFLRQTLTGAPAYPELGNPGQVQSIDAATALAPAGSGTWTILHDLVIEEEGPNQIAGLTEDPPPAVGSTMSIDAPAPFAWHTGSGTVSVKRADDHSIDCASLSANLAVTETTITVTFRRADPVNRCVLILSGIQVIPKAASPLVTQALLVNRGSAPGLPSVVGALALVTGQGIAPTIRLSASPAVITFGQSTTFTVNLGPSGANQEFRLEQDIVPGQVFGPAGVYRTDANGVAKLPFRPVFNRFYRVAFVGGGGLAGGVSPTVRVPVRFKIALSPVHASATVLRRGTTVTFTATAQPTRSYYQRPFIEFRLYHRGATGWRLATTKVLVADASGRARWSRTFAVRGDWYVRARAHQTYYDSTSILSPIARYSVR